MLSPSHRRVDDGPLANTVNHGAGEEWRVGELVAGGLLKLGFLALANFDDARDVDSKMPCTCALVRFDITMCSHLFAHDGHG